jgi:hypothetical protein
MIEWPFPTQFALGHGITDHLALPVIPYAVQAGMANSFVYEYSVWTQCSTHQPPDDGNWNGLRNITHKLYRLTKLMAQEDFIVPGILPFHLNDYKHFILLQK